MGYKQYTYRLIYVIVALVCFVVSGKAQNVEDGDTPLPQARIRREGGEKNVLADSVALDSAHSKDSKSVLAEDSLLMEEKFVKTLDAVLDSAGTLRMDLDSLASSMSLTKTRKDFVPDPKRAMWMAIVFPGGGQIYNRKYWKLPLVYGGFLGCVYAMNWNNTMYRDYSQAYIDIMDTDTNTKSYENFLPPHYDVEKNEERLKNLFRRKKDYYRRYRDLSMFCMIGVYALSIVDAYVDAEMSSFDINRDLTMKIRPVIINDRYSAMRANGMNAGSYGLQCRLSF